MSLVSSREMAPTTPRSSADEPLASAPAQGAGAGRPPAQVERPQKRFRAACSATWRSTISSVGPPAPAEDAVRLHLRRHRDRRVAARQPPGVRRARPRSADAERRVEPPSDDDAVRQDLRGAVRDPADRVRRTVRLPRRHRAGARGRGDERADDPQCGVADQPGGREKRISGGLVSGLSAPAIRRASSPWSIASPLPATTRSW